MKQLVRQLKRDHKRNQILKEIRASDMCNNLDQISSLKNSQVIPNIHTVEISFIFLWQFIFYI